MKFSKLIILLLVGLSLVSCQKKEEEQVDRLRPVRYMVVNKGTNSDLRNFTGEAIASNETELSFRSSGIITDLNVKVGSKVSKGSLIAKLDDLQTKLAYEKSESSLTSAESALNTAKSALERTKKLYEKGSAALSDYEKAKNNYQIALDQYEAAKSNKQLKKSQMDYVYIYAPASGVIAEVRADKNENVSAGRVIAVLNSGDGIDLEVGFPEGFVNKVKLGMNATVNFTSLENGKFEAVVKEVSPVLDPTTSTFPGKLSIKNPSSEIKPGMIAQISFDFSSSEGSKIDYIIVPPKSVGEDGDGNFVFLIEKLDENTGKMVKKEVEIGRLTDQGFEIISGLNQGDLIATAGLQTLLDGQKVSLK